MDGFLMIDCRPHGRIWTTDQYNNFEVEEWTNFRRTIVICYRWTEVDGRRTRTVHLKDGFGRRTIKILKLWTEVDGWTDGRKCVRGGLLHGMVHIIGTSYVMTIEQSVFFFNEAVNLK